MATIATGLKIVEAARVGGNVLTQALLRSVLAYEQETGVFVRVLTCGNNPAGTIAGSFDAEGYVTVGIGRKRYMTHCLAWLYVHGRFPVGEIDHIDMNRSNNALSNLREASKSQNGANKLKSPINKSGFKGVSLHKPSGLWRATICVEGKQHSFGYCKTPEEAAAIYASASVRFFGAFARVS